MKFYSDSYPRWNIKNYRSIYTLLKVCYDHEDEFFVWVVTYHETQTYY